MRLSSATLLLGSTSVLSALLVSAAPTLIRIKLIENLQLTREPDDFFRFVRIGAAGAGANTHSDESNLDHINAAVVSSGVLSNLDTDAGSVRIAGGPVSQPMRPELEFLSDSEMGFDPAQNQDVPQGILGCNHAPNLWVKVYGTINDFIMDFFGSSVESGRVLCSSYSRPQRDGQHYSALSNFTPASREGGISYHRNGSPISTMSATSTPSSRPGPWGYRRRPATFGGRLQRALYALSPWEGRAVAFVMGCGLGVLIRMLFVFVVLGVRLLSGISRTSEAEADKEKEEGMIVMLGDEDVEGVVLFDAGSLKGASVEDLPLYEEKQ